MHRIFCPCALFRDIKECVMHSFPNKNQDKEPFSWRSEAAESYATTFKRTKLMESNTWHADAVLSKQN